MMNFINLAHCAFAMLGGYVTVDADERATAGRSSPRCRSPFSPPRSPASCSSASLYRRLYRASDLDQVLLTIGIAFMSVAVAAYVFGTTQQPVQLPSYLRGSVDFLGLELRRSTGCS